MQILQASRLRPLEKPITRHTDAKSTHGNRPFTKINQTLENGGYMTKKERMRAIVSLVLSVISILLSLTAITCGLFVIFADTGAGEDMISGGALFAYAFVYLTEMFTALFAASASVLGAFFTFSVRKQEKKALKNAFLTLFYVNTVLAVLDILTAVVMIF